jgi:phosphohistidine phosphatase SixA
MGPAVATSAAQGAIFLVRHAERLDNSLDSPLSDEGRVRAARLAQMLRDARVDVIVVSEFQRTAQTAQPLADMLKVPVKKMRAADTDALVKELRGLDVHARALVVSHADRLPTLLRDLGYDRQITIPASEYDDLFVVFPRVRSTESVVVRLRY